MLDWIIRHITVIFVVVGLPMTLFGWFADLSLIDKFFVVGLGLGLLIIGVFAKLDQDDQEESRPESAAR